MLPLLSKIIRNAYAGFKLDHLQPADPFELADPEVREFAEEQRREREKRRGSREPSAKDRMFDEMREILSEQEIN